MSLELFDLTGRTALVTGSGQGIGLSLTEGLGRAGARVVLNGRDEAKLGAAAEIMRANVDSVFFVGQAVARHMIGRGRGKIVNIASLQAQAARYSIAPYTATKGAVLNLTKGMCTDWARHDLQVNAIGPGYFETPLNQALVDDPTFTEWLRIRTPTGRWGKVEELQGACIFLASDAANFVNGQIVYVDGGVLATL